MSIVKKNVILMLLNVGFMCLAIACKVSELKIIFTGIQLTILVIQGFMNWLHFSKKGGFWK